MRYIYSLLFSLGVLSVVALGAMMFWLTHRIDTQARIYMHEAHRLVVDERMSVLSLAVKDYAHWTLAQEWMRQGDAAALYENIGSAATASDLFDWIFLLSPDGVPLHAYGPGEPAEAAARFEAAGVAPFLEALRATPPDEYASVQGFAPWHGTVAAVAVARILPEEMPAGTAGAFPVMVGVKESGAPLLARLAQVTGAQSLGVTLAQAGPADPADAQPDPDVAGRDGLWLTGPDGPVAILGWDRPAPGTVLRREVQPVVGLAGFAMLAICFAAARFFGRQAKRLGDATQRATTDPLTGLLNRAGLEDRLRSPTLHAALAEGRVGVVNLDLNDFKALNDTLGHKSGDVALQVTADRLRRAVRETDHVARLGGDEFICLVVDRQPDRAARHVAARVADLCAEAIRFADTDRVLRPSIGVAVGRAGLDWETLLAQSDAAMYWAKKRAQDGPAFHDSLH